MAKVLHPVIDILGSLVALALILTIALALHYRRLSVARLIEIHRLNAQNAQGRSVANDFLNSCRLLSIHRNGRLNVFTFARGDQIFTVETMGLLSDNPDEWRTMAGLTQ